MPRPFRFAAQVSRAGSGADWVATARRLETLGYDTLSMADHVVGEGLANFPALAAAAVATTRLRLGNLVLDNDFRHPLVLAREALTLDLLSRGRCELGLGAGWLEDDYASLGIRFDRPSVRLARLAESLRVLRRLFTEDRVTFEGRYYRLRDARAFPRPVQRPHPPIIVAGGGPRLLAIAAHEADIAGLFVTRHFTKVSRSDWSLRAAEMQVEHVRQEAGPRAEAIEMNVTITDLVVTDDRRAAIAQVAREREQDEHAIETSPYVLIGTLNEIRAQVVAIRERLGISYFSLRGPFIEAVAPVVRELTGG